MTSQPYDLAVNLLTQVGDGAPSLLDVLQLPVTILPGSHSSTYFGDPEKKRYVGLSIEFDYPALQRSFIQSLRDAADRMEAKLEPEPVESEVAS